MKQKVPTPLITILQSRVFISRSIRAFKLKEIAKEWDIAIPTLFRYDSPEYRKLFNEDSRGRNKKLKVNRATCQICFDPLKDHLRCAWCTILVHDEPTCDCAEHFLGKRLHR